MEKQSWLAGRREVGKRGEEVTRGAVINEDVWWLSSCCAVQSAVWPQCGKLATRHSSQSIPVVHAAHCTGVGLYRAGCWMVAHSYIGLGVTPAHSLVPKIRWSVLLRIIKTSSLESWSIVWTDHLIYSHARAYICRTFSSNFDVRYGSFQCTLLPCHSKFPIVKGLLGSSK